MRENKGAGVSPVCPGPVFAACVFPPVSCPCGSGGCWGPPPPNSPWGPTPMSLPSGPWGPPCVPWDPPCVLPQWPPGSVPPGTQWPPGCRPPRHVSYSRGPPFPRPRPGMGTQGHTDMWSWGCVPAPSPPFSAPPDPGAWPQDRGPAHHRGGGRTGAVVRMRESELEKRGAAF